MFTKYHREVISRTFKKYEKRASGDYISDNEPEEAEYFRCDFLTLADAEAFCKEINEATDELHAHLNQSFYIQDAAEPPVFEIIVADQRKDFSSKDPKDKKLRLSPQELRDEVRNKLHNEYKYVGEVKTVGELVDFLSKFDRDLLVALELEDDTHDTFYVPVAYMGSFIEENQEPWYRDEELTGNDCIVLSPVEGETRRYRRPALNDWLFALEDEDVEDDVLEENEDED